MGSSPRMRGKLGMVSPYVVLGGLIPAHAGKTRFSSSASPSPPAHPRACGENVATSHAYLRSHGSSPRMRGKLRRSREKLPDVGLIPAHAGKTGRDEKSFINLQAHPRACGENLARHGHVLKKLGSSPRMRGKRGNLGRQDLRRGLIPAHAGKTAKKKKTDETKPAHPRACGENRRRIRRLHGLHGSSPRMRGKHRRPSGLRKRPGLIPAHAGKTLNDLEF